MQITILGCSGGIGGDLRTTAMLVDNDILIDAGSGVGDLSIEQLTHIDHVFLTHSHMDHIAFLPLLLDTVMGLRNKPITVHAKAETIDVLKAHIFNWQIWPDFNAIPDSENPLLLYNEVTVGTSITIAQRHFTALPANHVVPAVGYCIDSGNASLVFTGDTTICDELWPMVNAIKNLKYLIIETAFGDKEEELAVLSRHLCPSMLMAEMSKFNKDVEIYITHLKPGEEGHILQEIKTAVSGINLQALTQHQVFVV